MSFYKFLEPGAIGPFSRFRWPTPAEGQPGPWIDVEGELRLAANGVHPCRVDQLPYWLEAELWEVEIDGESLEAGRHVVARRGRLIRRVDAWTPERSTEMAMACVERSRGHAVGVLQAAHSVPGTEHYACAQVRGAV